MTISEIARLAGVSTSTVSRVFSHHPNIREDVRARVLAAAREHGYHPRLSSKQRNVVIVTPYDSVYPVQSCVDMILMALMRELPRRGFRLEVLPCNNLERLESIQFCGAVAVGAEPGDFKGWSERFPVPLVIVDRAAQPVSPDVCFVHSDERQGMTLAIDHLYRRGCRRIGCIIHGDPGTGKTMLAKAVACEAGVPFFSISGSDFVEMFVGVGASRVRDMFEQARKNTPCLIFIDEIDAVGRSRFSGWGGGHDEREQTLNAMLVEMDGLESRAGVIVLAATNRPDVLDPALLRPGRFDRQVVMDLPDITGRRKILDVHVKKIKVDPAIDLDVIARTTPGFSGADLANLCNEAALLAARRNREMVVQDDLEEARDKVSYGTERRSRKITERERRLTAYHEAGHALVALHNEHCTPVHKVTIIPRGQAYLGATFTMPKEDVYTKSKLELEAEMAMTMGGRAAEELVIGDITTGASSDINHLTSIARRMVCIFGMSEKIGPAKCGDFQPHPHVRIDMPQQDPCSPETAREIDLEVRRLVMTAMNEARECLKLHRDELEKLAQALLERETLSIDEINVLLGFTPEATAHDDVPGEAKEIRPTTDAGSVGNSL